MKPILYEFNETSFLTNGLGRLSEAISCYVEEAKNGIYELTMVYPVTGIHYADLKEGRLIYARHDDTTDRQPFRIYRISRPLNGRVEVSAHHRTYDLNKIILMPCSASSASAAMAAIEDNAAVSNGFTFWTDSVTSADWQVDVPSTVRSVLGGVRGSILDVYGGEFEWDDTIVKLHASRGQNTDVVISYGKNMTNLKYDTDDSDIWTGIVPFWRGNNSNDAETTVTLTEKVVYSSYRGNFQEDRYIPVDFSTEFEAMPTEAELRAKAESYVAANARPAIPASIDVSFIQLWQTEEYKTFAPLERLKLCDTVTIRHEVLGVEASGKIVKTKYDVLMERYASMTIGETRTNLASNIQRSISDAMQDVSDRAVTNSMMQAAIDHATDLLRGGLGGHVVINTNANGEPNEILVMDTDDIGTAVNVMRINVNGIGFSSNGYNGTYTSAWTLDGHFVADFITAGTMLANRIKGGTLQLGGSENGVGGDGVLKVYNAAGTQIGKWDKDGITVNKGTINGPSIVVGGSNNTSGTIEVKNSSGSTVVTLDNEGAKTKSGNNWSVFNSGYLKGGTDLYSSSSESGYISFNQHYSNTNTYGTRVAGRGMVAILTPVFAVGGYAGINSSANAYQGMTRNVTIVTGLTAPTVNVSVSSDTLHNVATCDASGNVTGYYGSVEFVKGVTVSVTPNYSSETLGFQYGLLNSW